MYHQDWLIRQIEIITRCVFTVLLGREDELSSEIHLETQRESPADASTLSFRLARLVRERRLCEAENLLYSAAEEGDPEALTAGLRFYHELNALSDELLDCCDFPRGEILSGLKELCAMYGYDLSVLGD